MLVRQGNQINYNYKEYYLDTEEDLDTIDINSLCPGSLAYIINTSKTFILNNNKEWKIQNSSSGGGDTDTRWTEIGYESEPSFIQDGIDYAKQIQKNWDASITDRNNAFNNDMNLIYFPNVDMSNITKANEMFSYCNNLEYFGEIKLGTGCNMRYMFNRNSNEYGKIKGKKITIEANTNNYGVFRFINKVEIDEVVLNISSNFGNGFFCGIKNLEIKKITNGGHLYRQNGVIESCTMSDTTIKAFLEYFKTLTNQSSYYKNLKQMGFTQANCNQAILLPEWTELEANGWTTGY